jgi:ABC-type sulfate/molybdate transport systems ATPase subunit
VLLLDEPFGALDAITRRQVRNELADILTQLQLPTLLVTHAFDDATALAQRIGVIDQGRLVQLAPPAELLAAPITVKVAALTGANVLEGTATTTQFGSTIRLEGGGELESSTPASGPVHVAVYPWQLELADAAACALSDTILDVRSERGSVTIRLTRFTLQATLSQNGRGRPTEGALVGLRAARQHVHVLRAGG